MFNPRNLLAVAMAAIVAAGLVACAEEPGDGAGGTAGQETAAPAAKRAPVAFTASEFSYTGPDTIDSGRNQVEFTNSGKQSHSLMFFKLGEGKTAADLLAMPIDGPVPSWLTFGGGLAGIEGGKSAMAILDLEPGSYVVTSFESADGDETPDAAKGMVHPLTVTASTSPEMLQAPTADVSIDMTEYSFTVNGELTAGNHMIQFNNKGTQGHETILMKMNEGTDPDQFINEMLEYMQHQTGTTGAASESMTETMPTGAEGAAGTMPAGTEITETLTAEQLAAMSSGVVTATEAMTEGSSSSAMTETTGAAPAGPPITSAGGMAPLSPSATAFATVDLTPGTYLMICFVPDPGGKPHVALGMHKSFTVK